MKILKKPQVLLGLISILGFLGFLDSTYLTINHYKNALPPCHLKTGCETVLTSQYSTISGVPIALIGAVFYLAVMGFAIILLQSKEGKVSKVSKVPNVPKGERKAFDTFGTFPSFDTFKILVLLISSGFIVSLILLFIQAFVLRAFCQYCLISEAISTLLLIFGVVLIRSK